MGVPEGSSDTARPLEIRLFGSLEIRARGEPLPRLRSRKGEWLVALLTLRAGGDVERSWLAGTLWPESDESLALYNLRRELTGLRQALGPESHRLTSPTPHTLRLDLAGAWADLLLFDHAIARGDPASLQCAVTLRRGPLLEGCAEEWVLLERESREQAYLAALEGLAQGALQEGDPAAAARWLRLAIAVDPLRETHRRCLMHALAECREYAAAVETYRELRALLYREYNAQPAPETVALFQTIRAGARRPVCGVPGSPAPRAPARPSGASAAGEAGAALPLPPGRVPRPLTELIGRRQEAAEVEELVRRYRLVTLTGSGGVGKSRLAIAVAERLRGVFADGVWFVELAPVVDPDLVPQSVAATLGLREQPSQPLVETLAGFLSTRCLLLVLDNCEHLVDACAGLAETLLRRCADLRMMTTSRQSLGLTGETVWRVPSLTSPPPELAAAIPADQRLVRLTEFDAVCLFVERARQSQPQFRATAENLPAVAQVCHRLDGIPLALELAAARTRALTVEQIARRLEGALCARFHLLTGGDRSALPRHQTLRAAIEWSYELLTAAERALLRRASVFAGGWTLEAGEAVCGEVEDPAAVPRLHVLDLLTQLVDRSLVIAEQCGAEVRYRLLETVREYARERLVESGELEEIRDRHLDYFVRLGEAAEPHVFGSVADPVWTGRLAAEIDNLRAAFGWCEASPERTVPALRLAAAIHWLWFLTGNHREGRERLRTALRQDTGAPTPARARALAAFAVAAFWTGDYGAMQAPLEEALPVIRSAGDGWGTAYTLCLLGAAAAFAGDAGSGRRHLEEAVDLARRQDRPHLVPFTLWWLGFVAQMAGDLDAARSAFEEGLELGRALGSRPALGHLTSMLGFVYLARGEAATARRYLTESLPILSALPDMWGTARALDGLALSARMEGHPERAAQLMGAAAALRDRIGASVPPEQREGHEQAVHALRSSLGEDRFAEAWAAGDAMPAADAVAYALSDPPGS